LDTLQKAVSEIRNELAQKKSEHQADGAQAANNSTPNLSPVGGTAAARDDARQGKDRLEFFLVNVALFLFLGLVCCSLLRSRFLGRHATLPQRNERCVTSQKTVAEETRCVVVPSLIL